MKKILKWSLALVAFGFLFASCGDGGAKNDLQLSVNKNEITADGEDKVIFTVTFEGRNVSSACKIYNATAGEYLPVGQTTFASKKFGPVEFYAEYDGHKSNTETIKVGSDLGLEPSKMVVTPDGKDVVTFKVVYKGEDVTSEATIKNTTTNQNLSGKTYSTTGIVPNTFVAEYQGTSSPEVVINAANFFHKVGMLRFTGTWCSWCYGLGTALNAAEEKIGDRLAYASIHGGDDMANEAGDAIINELQIGSYPDSRYEFRKKGTSSSQDIVIIVNQMLERPAFTGIKATSAISGTTVTVDVEVWARETKEYFLNVMLLEDGIVGRQADLQGNYVEPYTHNDVFRAAGAESAYGISIGTIEAGKKAEKQFTFDLENININAVNGHLMIYSLYVNNNRKVMDNCVDINVDGSIDYVFEPETADAQ